VLQMRIQRIRWIFIAIIMTSLGFAQWIQAEDRRTDVPNGFFNMVVGFTSVSNTNVTISGNKASWVGLSGNDFSVDLKEMKQQNNIWGGFALGYWFKQAPLSFGISGAMDFYPAIISEQTKQNVSYVVEGKPGTFTSFTKYRTRVTQIVPAFNIIVGLPLKFVRVYAGGGPGIFYSLYSFTVKNSAGKELGQVTAMDTKIGLNAFAGAEFFITRRVSAFVEGKYSQVNDLTFQPDKSDPLVAGRIVRDEYDSIKTQRAGVGISIHF